MRFAVVGVIAAIASFVAYGQDIEFGSNSGATFTASGLSLREIAGGVPLFEGGVTNHSSEEWSGVFVDVTVEMSCGEPKTVTFNAVLGDLKVGENSISDSIVSAKGLLSNGCQPERFSVIKMTRGRPAAEQRVIQAERDKRAYEEERAAAWEERKAKIIDEVRAKATCRKIYKSTVDKKVSDLTVRESKLVQTCSVLGYYK